MVSSRSIIQYPSRTYQALLSASLLISCIGLVSCSAFETSRQESAAPQALSEDAGAEVQSDVQTNVADKALPQAQLINSSASPRSAPQLIKKANLTLRVNTVETAIQTVGKITSAEGGDILNLQDQRPQRLGTRHIATVVVRVPQENLDRTLEQLRQLGDVQQQAIQAQDVSNQIVDSEARLRNLRKSETVVLGIMEKSGSIPNVLAVSKELSQIRANIETTDAQVKSLKTQVAYSTITLQLEAASVSTPPKDGLDARLNESWTESTHAMGEFLAGLLSLGVWMFVFSPFFVVIGLGAFSWNKYRKTKPQSLEPHVSNPLLAASLDGEVPSSEPKETIDD